LLWGEGGRGRGWREGEREGRRDGKEKWGRRERVNEDEEERILLQVTTSLNQRKTLLLSVVS
jgi:hypothetical protein